MSQQLPDRKTGSWDESFIYSIWKKYRAVEIKNNISIVNRQTFCIELISATAHDCDCIPFGCKVRKSVHPIPNVIGDSFANTLRVMTFSGTVIGYSEEGEIFSDSIDPVKKNRRRYSIKNGHILVWNDKDLKALQVQGPWEDPTEWIDIELCNDETTPGACSSMDTISAALTEEQSARVLENALKELLNPLQIKLALNNEPTDIFQKK